MSTVEKVFVRFVAGAKQIQHKIIFNKLFYNEY